ncbi:MAG: cell division protein FtsA [Rhodospirillales bacterium]|nr:cell division protein FtsA [Rhodospirillales bacterium]
MPDRDNTAQRIEAAALRSKRSAPPGWAKNGFIAALDIGTTKVSCLIARVVGEGIVVVGVGHQASRGLRSGTFVDLDAAEAAVRATVEAAERMARENIRQVIVNVSAGSPLSRLVAYEVAVGGHEIDDADLRRILEQAKIGQPDAQGREVVHAIPVGYSIDGCRGVRDPRGMFGQRLGVSLHLITAARGALRNLSACIDRCHLEIADKVVSSYAAALGCLVDDETTLGTTLIDMGGGTTSLAVFFDGELIHTDSIAIGGIHVTKDIARVLSTPLAQAERMKTLFGSCLPSLSDDRQVIEIPPMGEEGAGELSQVPRSLLVSVIRSRLEEVFEMLRARLEDAGLDKMSGRRVVLTGGASQIPGAPELASMILDKQVRIGRPRPMKGLPEAAYGPGFSTCAGLLRYAVNHPHQGDSTTYRPVDPPASRLSRLGQWLRENF